MLPAERFQTGTTEDTSSLHPRFVAKNDLDHSPAPRTRLDEVAAFRRRRVRQSDFHSISPLAAVRPGEAVHACAGGLAHEAIVQPTVDERSGGLLAVHCVGAMQSGFFEA